jgi:hypothetical protein
MEHDSKTDRDSRGRFTAGNKAARGNPYTRKAGEFRKALYASVTAKDIREVIAQLKEQAKAGDLKAIALFLDRTLGTVQNCGLDLLERLEQAEQTIEESTEQTEGE